jgi:hypothetical protein
MELMPSIIYAVSCRHPSILALASTSAEQNRDDDECNGQYASYHDKPDYRRMAEIG